MGVGLVVVVVEVGLRPRAAAVVVVQAGRGEVPRLRRLEDPGPRRRLPRLLVARVDVSRMASRQAQQQRR